VNKPINFYYFYLCIHIFIFSTFSTFLYFYFFIFYLFFSGWAGPSQPGHCCLACVNYSLICNLKTEDGNSGEDLRATSSPFFHFISCFLLLSGFFPSLSLYLFFSLFFVRGFYLPLFFCVSSQSSFFLHPPVCFPYFSLFGWFASVFSSSSAFLFWFLGSLFPPLSCASLLKLL